MLPRILSKLLLLVSLDALLLACEPLEPRGFDTADTDLAETVQTDVVELPEDALLADTSELDVSPPTALALEVGEVVTLAVESDVAQTRLLAELGYEEFVVILVSGLVSDNTSAFPYDLALDDSAELRKVFPVDGCTVDEDIWPQIPPVTELPNPAVPIAVGATRSFWFSSGPGSQQLNARAIAVGDTAVVWLDVASNMDSLFAKDFLSAFENIVLPRSRTVFGQESDVDGDGRIHLFFTPRTYNVAVAFFSGCDLLEDPYCPQSNNAEMLYLTPPDSIPPPYNTTTAITEILTHELQHLIHFNRKVLRNPSTDPWNDNMYLQEGFGGLAQDVVGYQAGNLYVTKAGFDSIDDFSIADVIKDGGAYDSSRDGALRGGAYLFARWLYDRAGGDAALVDGELLDRGGISFIHALFDGPKTMGKELSDQTNQTNEAITADFFTALALTNRNEIGGSRPLNPCFAYLDTIIDPVTARQRGASAYANFHGQAMTGPAMQTLDTQDGSLRAGGVEYFSLVADGSSKELGLRVDIPSAARPWIRIARIK
ncbi:MAG: hypothetical protein CO108_20230 [Deltaproteobacteria bacterium CG_4_9_14_3_um_filter_63_12]|nr:MAG: hypothetical protein CO108_20230 [Deltaproteobacteria bacterium CG_4_9_14_3_um_filter_63_12]